jgi:hypothetical protein
MAGALPFLLLVAFSFRAADKIAAFAVASQTATVLLLSPEVLRPFRRLRYFSRPLTVIRARRRRILGRGATASAVLLAVLALRILDIGEAGSNSSLTGAIVVLLGLICGLGVLTFAAIWVIDMLFKGAAETWMQTAFGQFGSERTVKCGGLSPERSSSSGRFCCSGPPTPDRRPWASLFGGRALDLFETREMIVGDGWAQPDSGGHSGVRLCRVG